jgi:4-alpha-glucanotransferase
LIPLVDLAAAAGLRVLQLLPVNDTRCAGSWWDSYPYSACSTAALHPLYLRPQALQPPGRLPAAAAAELAAAQRQLEALPAVDYERALDAKLRAAKAHFEAACAPGQPLAPGSTHPAAVALAEFEEREASWLRPYAVFCHLKDDVFGTAEHWRYHRRRRRCCA